MNIMLYIVSYEYYVVYCKLIIAGNLCENFIWGGGQELCLIMVLVSKSW